MNQIALNLDTLADETSLQASQTTVLSQGQQVSFNGEDLEFIRGGPRGGGRFQFARGVPATQMGQMGYQQSPAPPRRPQQQVYPTQQYSQHFPQYQSFQAEEEFHCGAFEEAEEKQASDPSDHYQGTEFVDHNEHAYYHED